MTQGVVGVFSAERVRDPQPVYFVHHVPKCAGRTIDRHLATALPAGSYFRTRKRRGPSRFLLPRYDLSGMSQPNQVVAVGGHFLGVSIQALFADRPVKRSILLRDPASHLISYYNFRMMRYISEGLQAYSFELSYGATQRNFITHYILSNFLELSWCRIAGMSEQDKYDLVNAFLASFWYVGDYSSCDNLVHALGTKLAIPGTAIARNTQQEWKARVAWQPIGLDDLPAGTVAQIRCENHLDKRLWESWRDAGHDTCRVRPRALSGRIATTLVSQEATRLVHQIARRVQRRWGRAEGPRVPAGVAVAR